MQRGAKKTTPKAAQKLLLKELKGLQEGLQRSLNGRQSALKGALQETPKGALSICVINESQEMYFQKVF